MHNITIRIKERGGLRPPPSFILTSMLCIISLYINIYLNLAIYIYICIYLFMYICVHFCIFVYICLHVCIFVHIFVYSHLSSNDAPRDSLQNERLETYWGGLWLELWPFLYFREFSSKWWFFL